jgi:hypothetical protein
MIAGAEPPELLGPETLISKALAESAKTKIPKKKNKKWSEVNRKPCAL